MSDSPTSSSWRVAVTGSTGLIGTALCAHLRKNGHTVLRVVRRNATGDDITWDPAAGTIETTKLEGVDAVVHLAGEGIAESKWTDDHKRKVMDSRVKGTTLLASTIAGLNNRPAVFASGSAMGYYGNTDDRDVTEASPAGNGFLSTVVKAWEESTRAAEDAGVRTAHLRTGIVLSTKGGALKQQLLPFKLGAGGRMGSGKQYLPWISIVDEVRAIEHVIATASLRGPVNLTAPNPVTNLEFTKALGTALKRPTILPIPLAPLKVLYGADMVREMLLEGSKVLPKALLDSGFEFTHTQLDATLRALLDGKL
jgi:uncharacterized protein